MPKRVQATGAQKRNFLLHTVVFIIATVVIWYMYKAEGIKTGKWVYPWQAWVTAAWGLAVIGHWCAVYRSYTDPNHDEFTRQTQN